MKNILKEFFIYLIVSVVVIISVEIYIDNFGNPRTKKIARENIISYVIDTYQTTDFSMTDTEYYADTAEYGSVIEFYDSEDTVFYVAYSPKENKITDTYNSTVANGYNTFIRLNAEYGRIISNVLNEHYAYENIMCYGELGKNHASPDYSTVIYPDMSFDMYNLPLEATVSVFFEREDVSAEQFAKDLTELQKLMYANEIAVDYYDIMYNGTVLLEDFPSETVVEHLEDIEILSEKIKEFMYK